jgi:hypothetical protein
MKEELRKSPVAVAMVASVNAGLSRLVGGGLAGKRLPGNVKNGFLAFFDWNPLPGKILQLKRGAAIFRIFRKIFGGWGVSRNPSPAPEALDAPKIVLNRAYSW